MTLSIEDVALVMNPQANPTDPCHDPVWAEIRATLRAQAYKHGVRNLPDIDDVVGRVIVMLLEARYRFIVKSVPEFFGFTRTLIPTATRKHFAKARAVAYFGGNDEEYQFFSAIGARCTTKEDALQTAQLLGLALNFVEEGALTEPERNVMRRLVELVKAGDRPSAKAIAEGTESEPAAVRVHLHRARRKLHSSFVRHGILQPGEKVVTTGEVGSEGSRVSKPRWPGQSPNGAPAGASPDME